LLFVIVVVVVIVTIDKQDKAIERSSLAKESNPPSSFLPPLPFFIVL